VVPALIPTVNGKSASVVGGENIVIFSGSTKQDAAFRFVQFMLTAEVQLKLLEVGVIPTLKACVESDAVKSNPKWSVYMQQLGSAQSRIPTPQASTVEQLWTDAMTMIFVEGADVQQTLTATAAQIDTELAK
jgi:multiple sugar transport system substrate-binding protein